ncbi:MAG: hypothetical protein HY016_01915 [Nitrosomonadales bacterium]|nr:hypothetical protein [Nitrosomonadales bacterium]
MKKQETRPCRICKTPLVVKDHLSIVYKSNASIVDGDPISSSLKYTPCPKCGEPKPILEESAASASSKWVIAILLVVIGIAAAAYLKFAGH